MRVATSSSTRRLAGAAAWPLAARAQQAAMPIVGLVTGGRLADTSSDNMAAFRKGLGETGYLDGKNVTVEYHRLEGQFDRLPGLMADLVRRRVAVIVTPATTLMRSRPKLQPQRSQSCSESMKTQSSLVLSPASPGRVATRPASTFSPGRWWQNGWDFCMNWCPRPLA
jgi:hypothetical protein